jgi:hypothetical protein
VLHAALSQLVKIRAGGGANAMHMCIAPEVGAVKGRKSTANTKKPNEINKVQMVQKLRVK